MLKRDEVERQEKEALRQRQIAEAIARCVGAHREHLSLKRDAGTSIDEYGKLEDAAWQLEVKRFTQRVVLDEIPETRAYSEKSIIEATRKTIESILGPASSQSRHCGF